MLERLLVAAVVTAYLVVVAFALLTPVVRESIVRPPMPAETGTASVSGRIVDEDERGLDGVQVVVSYGGGPWYRREATTGHVGEFRLTGLPEGEVGIRLGMIPTHLTLGVREVLVRATATEGDPIVIRLRRPVSITGKLADERGRPVTDCQIGFDVWPDWAVSPAPDGSFELARLSPEVDYDIEVAAFSTTWEPTWRKHVRGGTKDLEIVMKPRSTSAMR